MKEEFPYYVYTWAYPDGVVFYVGVGQNQRYKDMKGRNHVTKDIVRFIESTDGEVQRVIVARFRVRQHALVYERMLIATYGIDNLANVVEEDKPELYQLARPFAYNAVVRIPPKHWWAERATQQDWEDDGAEI